MSNLVVVPNELSGWDVVRDDDRHALTNHATKESALEAARLRAEEEHTGVEVHEDESHGIDDTGRGVKTYVFALLGLLCLVTVIIVVTSLLASATGT